MSLIKITKACLPQAGTTTYQPMIKFFRKIPLKMLMPANLAPAPYKTTNDKLILPGFFEMSQKKIAWLLL